MFHGCWYGLRGVQIAYAADAFVVVKGHAYPARVAAGRYRHWRRAIQWTGVPLWPGLVSAVGGFWLNWDRSGPVFGGWPADWLYALPILAPPWRNFLGDVSLSDRLFTLFIFIHIGMPLLMVFGPGATYSASRWPRYFHHARWPGAPS